MLPYVVIVMAVGYLVLHYSGAFEASGSFFRNRFKSGDGQRSRRAGNNVEDEIQRRLGVFEDFLRGQDSTNEDE